MYPTLTTERLELIPFTTKDEELFHRINTDPFVRKLLWDDEVIGQEVSKEIMGKNEAHFREDAYGLWKILSKDSKEVIGYAGLWFFFDEPQPQLIYAILEAFTKKGYATEASRAVIDYTFNQLGFSYLLAATDESHTESQSVAQRLGMKFTEKRIENEKPTLFFRIDK